MPSGTGTLQGKYGDIPDNIILRKKLYGLY